MSATKKIRFSVDTGGTFTDIVVLDEETGHFSINKAATTPQDILIGLQNVIRKAQVDLSRVSRFFVHGSTTALNALLERKGARTAYLATAGFRDVPQIGRINRPEIYNPKYHKPPQLVPRDLRFDVIERLDADGRVVTPLDEQDVRRIAREIRERDVKAVAVCLLHAYRNPVHELCIKQIFHDVAPEISVTISSQVAPEPREYERSTTTILNAYLAPIVEQSIDALERTLAQHGFKSDIVLTKSDGGGMSASVARNAAINTLFSGPAGGIIGALQIAQLTGCKNLVTADVGGTSFDVGVIKNGAATANQELNAAGFPVLISNLDVRTIGAGCGSIAWLDAAGALHVGPHSAGAQPGPICYARGGLEPTVTDAALINGYIDPGYFLGGEMRVDVELARRGLEDRLARPLGLELATAATGVLKIARSHMVGAVRDMLAESGDDPREFRLLCYGGGGPLFAAALVEELHLPGAIIPFVPANFSAWGMLMFDIHHNVTLPIGRALHGISPQVMRDGFYELESKAHAILDHERIARIEQRLQPSLDMRYAGQGHTVCVPFPTRAMNEALIAAIYEAFQSTYEAMYGYRLSQPADVVSLRIKAIGEIPKPRPWKIAEGGRDAGAAVKGRRGVIDMIDGAEAEHVIYERSSLLAGNRMQGPAIIEEPTTITPVRAGQRCSVDSYGNLIITRV